MIGNSLDHQNCAQIYIADSFESRDQLSQGDILFWENEDNPIKRFGIVVTADCDLAQNKFWEKVSVVPFFSIAYYIENFSCKKRFAKHKEKLYTIIKKELKKEGIDLDNEHIDSYLIYRNTSKELSRNTTICINLLKHILNQDKIFPTNIDAAHALYEVIKSDSLFSEIKNDLTTPNEEFYYLGNINKEILQCELELPAIAWLRIIREVNSSEILLTRSQSKEIGKGIRIARLSPVYKYGLTHRLGQIFSSIGLPDAHNELKKNQIDQIIKSIGG